MKFSTEIKIIQLIWYGKVKSLLVWPPPCCCLHSCLGSGHLMVANNHHWQRGDIGFLHQHRHQPGYGVISFDHWFCPNRSEQLRPLTLRPASDFPVTYFIVCTGGACCCRSPPSMTVTVTCLGQAEKMFGWQFPAASEETARERERCVSIVRQPQAQAQTDRCRGDSEYLNWGKSENICYVMKNILNHNKNINGLYWKVGSLMLYMDTSSIFIPLNNSESSLTKWLIFF